MSNERKSHLESYLGHVGAKHSPCVDNLALHNLHVAKMAVVEVISGQKPHQGPETDFARPTA
jgi:hypothetical protein